MKKITLLLLLTFTVIKIFAQSPEKMSYQAVIRNSSNQLIINQQVGVQISILQGSVSGTAVYIETQSPVTNANGLISIEIGSGITGNNFSDIDWANGPYFIKTETDLTGGTNYTITGTNQLISVPYSLYAKTTKNYTGTITESQISDLGNYIETETDPVFGASVSEAITESDTANWNNKYNLPTLTTGSILFRGEENIGEDNNNLYWDNTNKRIGIGTNMPLASLELKSHNSNLSGSILKVINNINDSVMTITGQGVKVLVDSTVGSFTIGLQSSTSSKNILVLTPDNCFIGYKSGVNNNSGSNNMFLGYQSGYSNTNGNYNLFIGYKSGLNNTTGSNNLFIGKASGYANTIGNSNTYLGSYSGDSNIDGDDNLFIGYNSGTSNTSGDYNTFLGSSAGASNSTGTRNTFVGYMSGYLNSVGQYNTFLGQYSGYNLTNGYNNVFIGNSAGSSTTSGGMNICIGDQTGSNNSTGTNNTFIGYQAGYDNTGSGNVFIGNNAGYNETGSNKLYIDNSNTIAPLIYGDFNSNTLKINGNMGVNYNGVSGYGLIVETPASQSEIYALYVMGNAYATGNWNSSDESFKKNIKPLQNSLNKVLLLNGYTYEWKINEFPDMKFDDRKQIGLIAQEVEKIFPELVKEDEKGYKAIDYGKFTPILIEAIKEQQKQIEELETINEKLIERLDKLENK